MSSGRFDGKTIIVTGAAGGIGEGYARGLAEEGANVVVADLNRPAADRTADICQSQSVNILLPGDVDKWDLHMLHWQAWERGMKSLYYLRSKSVQRASHAGADTVDTYSFEDAEKTDYDECLACQ